jgi:hypothetical protein
MLTFLFTANLKVISWFLRENSLGKWQSSCESAALLPLIDFASSTGVDGNKYR